MIAEKPLALIAVADGKSGDLFWIRMDGSEDSCNPDSFMHAFPQLSCVAIDDDSGFVAGFQSLVNAAAANIGSADVCLDDSWSCLPLRERKPLSGKCFLVRLRACPIARNTTDAAEQIVDASGTSALVIDNLSVTWLTAAASTQPFDAR